MATLRLIDRFSDDDDGRRRLIACLGEQSLVGRNETIATALSKAATLQELAAGEILTHQGGVDNDVFFILVGSIRVFVNGREVAQRSAGTHVGEMAMIDTSLTRTATTVATEQTVTAKLSEGDFTRVAQAHPELWRGLAIELGRRLHQRGRFHVPPNTTPILFIGSSKESLPLAEAIKTGLPPAVAAAVLWSEGVFGASSFPIDDLEAQVKTADFAILVGAADDRVTSRGVAADAPRDNVVFELGLFMGALSRRRTFLVVPNGMGVKIPTDLLGMTTLRYDPAVDPIAAAQPVLRELCAIIESLKAK